jgi:hypothetical protein
MSVLRKIAKAGRKGGMALEGFEARSGAHCESSAMLNALSYLGYGLGEADIVGGGGAPSFIFMNESFPFIGGRNERMREIFLEAARIPCGAAVPRQGDPGWREIVALLERGLPVLLRVDMRWLPYLYGGKYGPPYMSFGGHWVCLHALDLDSGEASVTDTALGGPCRARISDLEKARLSATKTFPPRGEYAWIEARPSAWEFDADAVTESALAEVLANYGDPAGGATMPLVGIAGLAAFPEALASVHAMVNAFALAPAYSYMAGSIERNGTGGAAFRRLFRDFLANRAGDCGKERLRSACAALLPKVEEAMAAWSGLAASFDEAAAALDPKRGGVRVGAAGYKAAVGAAEETTAARARLVYAAERGLRDAIMEAGAS